MIPSNDPYLARFSAHSFEDDLCTHTYFVGPEKCESTGFVDWKFRAVVGATVRSPVIMRLIHVIEVSRRSGKNEFSDFLQLLPVSYLREMKYSVR